MSAVSPAAVSPAAPQAMSPREVRRTVRRMRRTSVANRPLLETLQNLYVVFFTVLLTVALVGPAASRALEDLGTRSARGERLSGLGPALAVALLLAAFGASLRALAVLGPLVRDPAEATWVMASPVDRRGLLAPATVALLLLALVAGAVLGGAAALVAAGPLGLWLLAGTATGLGAAATATGAQGTPAGPWLRRVADAASVLAVALLVAGLAGAGTWLVHAPAVVALVPALLVVLALVAVATVPRRLARLRRIELVAGAGLALGLRATVTGLDGSILAETLRARSLLERGSVRLRPLRGNGGKALVAADLRRALRSPRPLLSALGATPVVWTVGTLYGRLAAVAALAVLAWCAAASVAAGLRSVSRSRAIARSLPFDDARLRLLHCVVPAAGALLVSSVVVVAGGRPLWWVLPATFVGLCGAVRTAGGRKPVRWELQATSPMGALPVGALVSYLVGVDVVTLAAVPWLAGAGPSLSFGVPAIVLSVLLNRRNRKEA